MGQRSQSVSELVSESVSDSRALVIRLSYPFLLFRKSIIETKLMAEEHIERESELIFVRLDLFLLCILNESSDAGHSSCRFLDLTGIANYKSMVLQPICLRKLII